MSWIARFFSSNYIEWDDYVKQIQEIEDKCWIECEERFSKKARYTP